MIALFVVAMLHQTPAQRRAVAAQESAEINTVTIPGADFSDEAAQAAALHFCGTTKDCADTFRTDRDKLVKAYAIDHRHRKAILKLIGEERDGQFVNWHTSFERYDAKYKQPPEPWFGGVPFGPYVFCTTFGSTTTCTSRGYR